MRIPFPLGHWLPLPDVWRPLNDPLSDTCGTAIPDAARHRTCGSTRIVTTGQGKQDRKPVRGTDLRGRSKTPEGIARSVLKRSGDASRLRGSGRRLFRLSACAVQPGGRPLPWIKDLGPNARQTADQAILRAYSDQMLTSPSANRKYSTPIRLSVSSAPVMVTVVAEVRVSVYAARLPL